MMHCMQDKLLVRLEPELKDLIEAEAKRQDIYGGMGEMAVRILAGFFKRPDLARVPRKPMGRPRKHVHSRNGNGKLKVTA